MINLLQTIKLIRNIGMDCFYFVKSDNRNNESDISVKTSSIGNGDNYEEKKIVLEVISQKFSISIILEFRITLYNLG